jgi:hydrogenase maturation protein HypF
LPHLVVERRSHVAHGEGRVNEARMWLFGGRVQGVGFRPFVYRTARRYEVEGWVRNLAGSVEVLAQGRPEAVASFGNALVHEAPPLAKPRKLADAEVPRESLFGFAILRSSEEGSAHTRVPPDYFACNECLAELRDAGNRRYRYPFINCTQCGPRFTLIHALPYDRASTSMAAFSMCARCADEYADPADRRFHAEPVACPECGPRLLFHSRPEAYRDGEAALAACVAALREGLVVAVKGIGGYHLMCDATSPAAVSRLRERKVRPHKPLAVMFPVDGDLAMLEAAAELDPVARESLLDASRPIVLLRKRAGSAIAPDVAPDCSDIGAFLPYSPLHHLLLADLGRPLVATSANLSGEPVLTDNEEVEVRLARVADAFLHHDRPILRPADDSVYRIVLGRARPLRIGRGIAPLEIELPFALPSPILALGGHMKNTVTLAWNRRAVISPHLGDMDAPRSLALLERMASDLQSMHGVRAERIACDAHPGYGTSRLARQWGLPVSRIFHHRAHASALFAELPYEGDALVFAWDGSGLGEDGALWGGEALLGRPGAWKRVASWRPFALPGGDRAAREPWRVAAALHWEAGRDWDGCPEDPGLLRHAWERGLNCPRTSSVGRLFDAASAMVGLTMHSTYEAQAPMALEAACAAGAESIALPLDCTGDICRTDWEPLLDRLCDARIDVSERAAMFHATLAGALIGQARAIRERSAVSRIGLTGGVFQNRVLCEQVASLAERDGFELLVPREVPLNDAGLSLGQVLESGAA